MRTEAVPAAADEERRAAAAALLDTARTQSRGGSLERAWQACLEAAAIGRALGDATIVADAAMAITGPQIVAFRLTDARRGLCLEAIAMVGTSDADLHHRLEAHLAAISSAWLAGEPSGALSGADPVDPRGVGSQFAPLQADHADALGPQGVAARLAIASKLIALGVGARDEEVLAWGRLWMLDALLQLGLRVEFNRELILFSAVVSRLGSPQWEWRLAAIHTNLALLEDRLDDVAVLAARARQLGTVAGADDAAFIDLIVRSNLARRTGAGLAEIETEVRHAIADAPFLAQGWRALLLAQLGRIDEATGIWRALSPHASQMPMATHEWLVATADFASLAVVAEDRAAAQQLLRQLLPFAHLHVAGPAMTSYGGPVALVLGTLAAFLGDTANARAWLDDARQRSEAMNAPWYAAEARRARAALGQHAGPLSPREHEVALLVAEGHTNRQIARRLVLSERTVEQHVRSMLHKLGLPNRSAVAAWVTRGARG